MSRIDEILAKQKALADELEMAKQEERDAVLKDIKEKIKLFNFKTTDFKGVLATRKKRGGGVVAKNSATRKAPK
jgi:hypothetical protein